VRLGLSARQARDHHLILVISVAAPSWSSTARGPAAHDRRQRGAALWLTQAVVLYLRERGSGSIVHVAARPGLEPAAGMAASAVRIIPCPVSSSPAPPTDSAAPPPVPSSGTAMTLSCTPAAASGRRRSATSPRTPREWSSATSSAAETRDLAGQVNQIGQMDAVIHNAGVFLEPSRAATVDGHAKTLAVNTLAPSTCSPR
jgi:hypothetical protein